MDELFVFFIKTDEEPIIINKKDVYSKTEYELYSQKIGIPIEQFEEIAISTNN